jgi:hypothetical protein
MLSLTRSPYQIVALLLSFPPTFLSARQKPKEKKKRKVKLII